MWCVVVVIRLITVGIHIKSIKYPGIRTMQVILPLAFFLAPKPICYYGLLFEHPVSMILCQIGDQTLSMEVSTSLFSGTNTSYSGHGKSEMFSLLLNFSMIFTHSLNFLLPPGMIYHHGNRMFLYTLLLNIRLGLTNLTEK